MGYMYLHLLCKYTFMQVVKAESTRRTDKSKTTNTSNDKFKTSNPIEINNVKSIVVVHFVIQVMVLLQGLCYVVDITMVFLTFIGIFDFVFHLVELSRVDERGLTIIP